MLSARNAVWPKPCTRRNRNPTTSTHGVCTATTSAAVTRYTRAAVPSANCSTHPTVVGGWWIRRRSVNPTVATIEPTTAAAATAYDAGVGTPPSMRSDSVFSPMDAPRHSRNTERRYGRHLATGSLDPREAAEEESEVPLREDGRLLRRHAYSGHRCR